MRLLRKHFVIEVARLLLTTSKERLRIVVYSAEMIAETNFVLEIVKQLITDKLD